MRGKFGYDPKSRPCNDEAAAPPIHGSLIKLNPLSKYLPKTGSRPSHVIKGPTRKRVASGDELHTSFTN